MSHLWRGMLAAALILASVPTHADKTGSEFARVANGADGRPRALQMAVVTYTPGNNAGYSVDLISAIHIGDKAYYDELNRRFQDYDVLLYELIVPDEKDGSPADNNGSNLISSTQIGLKNALGLAFQLDEVDYGADNFVHADLSTTALKQRMKDRGESLYVYFWRMFFISMNDYASDPLGVRDMHLLSQMLSGEQGDALKVAVARQMVDTSREFDILGGGESGSAVIAARNEHAIAVLRQQLDAGVTRIGVFYGVGHMPDLERRLTGELSLKRSATVWLDAWRFRRAAEAVSN